MARQGITQEQVSETAEALSQEGRSITISSIRERIGSGSYSTISALLAQWKIDKENREPDDTPDLPASIENALRQVWAFAWKETQAQTRVQRESLEATRREMERETQEMTSEISRLETENNAQREEFQRLSEQLEKRELASIEAENINKQLIIENARLDERVKAAEAKSRQTEAREKTLTEAKATIQALKIENARLEERAEASEKNNATLRDELNNFHTHIGKLTGQKSS